LARRLVYQVFPRREKAYMLPLTNTVAYFRASFEDQRDFPFCKEVERRNKPNRACSDHGYGKLPAVIAGLAATCG
ncbi:MAG TPA: hypothetical protein VHM24_01530, partial [Gemmatimonadaceae bacterium]|nr:hypothetical protein [Gemmatimonadaceae bacterium]